MVLWQSAHWQLPQKLKGLYVLAKAPVFCSPFTSQIIFPILIWHIDFRLIVAAPPKLYQMSSFGKFVDRLVRSAQTKLWQLSFPFVSTEGLESSDGSADDKAVDVVSAFVGVDGFQVHDVSDDVVFVANTVAAQHVSRRPRNVQRFAAIVTF